MRTKTPEQLHNQWLRISGYIRQRYDRETWWRYLLTRCRYFCNMAEYNGDCPSFRNGYVYNERTNAPVSLSVYTRRNEKSINELTGQLRRILDKANGDSKNPHYRTALKIWRRYIANIKESPVYGEDKGYSPCGTRADTPVMRSVYAQQTEA